MDSNKTAVVCKVARPKYPSVYPPIMDIFENPPIIILSKVPRVLSCTKRIAHKIKLRKCTMKAEMGMVYCVNDTNGFGGNVSNNNLRK